MAYSSVQELPVNTDWWRGERSARGESLKIPASPSVTTLSFRSHMFLKKRRGRGGPTECKHNIFFSAPSWLCVPQKWPFPGCWGTMSWESEVKCPGRESQNGISVEMIRTRQAVPGLYKQSYTVSINDLSFLLCAFDKSQTNLGSGVRHQHLQHGRSKCLPQEKREPSPEMSSWHRWPQIPF